MRPWLCMPSASAATIERATESALDLLVLDAQSVLTLSSLTCPRVSATCSFAACEVSTMLLLRAGRRTLQQPQEQNLVTGTGSRDPLPSQKTSFGLIPLLTRYSMTALARISDRLLSLSPASKRSLWPVMMTEPTASGRVSLPTPDVTCLASWSSSFLPSSLRTALLNSNALSP